MDGGKLIPPLAGLAEAAEMLGWSKSQVNTYMTRAKVKNWPDDMFPKPIQVLASGPIWFEKQIETFRDKRNGRRRDNDD